MTSATRLLVADDDATFRAALVEAFAGDDRFEVVGQTDDATGVVELVAETEADVLLLDVRMPGGGIEAAQALRDQASSVVVVVVSAQTAPRTVASLIKLGARGYLEKGRLGPDLPDLVARCVAGEVVLAVPTAAQALDRIAR